MLKLRTMVVVSLCSVGACGGAGEPPPARALAGVAVLRVDAEEFRKLRGQWRGTEVGGRLEWTFSFGDGWTVVVGNAAGEWYEGQAGLHFELGAGRDGIIRVPPGSGMIDVDVWTSRRAAYERFPWASTTSRSRQNSSCARASRASTCGRCPTTRRRHRTGVSG